MKALKRRHNDGAKCCNEGGEKGGSMKVPNASMKAAKEGHSESAECCNKGDRKWEHQTKTEATAKQEAHYMLGLALLQRQESSKGIRELEKALDLGRGANPKGYMVEEIWQELAKAKYHEWERTSSKRSWELQSLKEACESALKEKHFLDVTQMEGFVEDATTSHLEQLEALERVINKKAEADTPTEVPDYLCCRITLDIYHDPVITPSGLTYEREVILEHLQKVGKFDPITREPLDQSQLVPNLAIKEAVQAFLDKHGWAYKVD
uniref:RING-type E3 ubiquitin transferase n=1 Tax=Cajanus cajan TaxID=3821 RepID=A0A151QZD8_CAJCA|nr:E3 ubiquitin-protein ligase CHIP [Cajanus cajan]